ncbi:MAG: hypothetical protein JWQ87_1036 [Candidatus Sulfotelmatobacter sp.]|nr:hypothetical protein [Candidatus Sulfotelmatobacter sp.]
MRSILKSELLQTLQAVDKDAGARTRILALETEFRRRIGIHVESLPASDALFSKFNTNPFVLMIHSHNKGYKNISQIESDILPAKVFSSMETSAGRMVEAVVLPKYGWEVVPSGMHSIDSVLDGKKKSGDVLCLATLKSGPRCLNDEMSANIADDILANFEHWATEHSVTEIDFTYGVLYGTNSQSNKKDWHILRNIEEKLTSGKMLVSPNGHWTCKFEKNGITVTVTIRIGVDLWNYIGGTDSMFTELSTSIIRACITPSDVDPADYKFQIKDLPEIISMQSVPENFNVALLQWSQLEWFFFFARHFCDRLLEV